MNDWPTVRGEGGGTQEDVQIPVLGDKVDEMPPIHWEKEWAWMGKEWAWMGKEAGNETHLSPGAEQPLIRGLKPLAPKHHQPTNPDPTCPSPEDHLEP